MAGAPLPTRPPAKSDLDQDLSSILDTLVAEGEDADEIKATFKKERIFTLAKAKGLTGDELTAMKFPMGTRKAILQALGAFFSFCLHTTHTILQPRLALLQCTPVVRVPRLLCSELCVPSGAFIRVLYFCRVCVVCVCVRVVVLAVPYDL